ncbi:hypothetical protein, partial [Pseudomonas aeruginosa]|uniref:hypothetical protein n=1 Tax=Pseudomonas aeruginosa TaxID=287 RepID=UPI0019D58378
CWHSRDGGEFWQAWAAVVITLASHNVYYVKLDAMSEMFMSLVSLRLREFETIWLGSRFLARLW